MSKELSLKTRASAAYVQGRLAGLVKSHKKCVSWQTCSLAIELGKVLEEWLYAESALFVKSKRKKEPK